MFFQFIRKRLDFISTSTQLHVEMQEYFRHMSHLIQIKENRRIILGQPKLQTIKMFLRGIQNKKFITLAFTH